MRLLLVSDTHVPRRAKELPPQLLDDLPRADVVVHAGDWVDTATLDLLESRARRLIAVYGNNDGPELRARLPEVAYAELAGVRLGVVHETGPAPGRERRCAERFPELDVLVFGHSHIPWDSTADDRLRLLNPGSPTDRRRQPYCTYMTAELSAGGSPRWSCTACPAADEAAVTGAGSGPVLTDRAGHGRRRPVRRAADRPRSR